MTTEEAITKEKILNAAKAEFSYKGFRDASLRSIVKTAGVSTGSFYWHFENKGSSALGIFYRISGSDAVQQYDNGEYPYR